MLWEEHIFLLIKQAQVITMQVFKLYGKEIFKEQLKLHQLYVGGLENIKIKLGNIRTSRGNLGLSEEQDVIHFSEEGFRPIHQFTNTLIVVNIP